MLTVKKAFVLGAAFLLCASGAASAAVVDVNVPFSFVVHGQTLPAGQYRIQSEGSDVLLINGEHGTKAALFVMTMPAAGSDPAGDRPALTFGSYETGRRLTDVWASRDEGFAVSPAPAAKSVGAKKTVAKSHTISGVVKSIDDKTMVISRTGKKSDLTFALDSSTGRGGTINVGTPVSVRYRMQGTSRSALYITARKK
jgi:hypothetical protein